MATIKQKRRLIFKLNTCITLLMAFFLVKASSVFGQSEKHTVRSANGTTIGYTIIGSGSVPIVFVHGALNSGEQWMQVATALSEHCTCYVMDRWGRGDSDNHKDYSVKREAEDIIAVLKAAGPNAFLLGHSSGAIYALEAALEMAPAGLILYEPPIHGFIESRFVEDVWPRIQIAAKEKRLKDVLTIFLKDEAEVSDEELAFLQSTPLWDHMLSLTPHSVREWAELVQKKPTTSRYQEIGAPTLLLTGSRNTNHPSFATQALNKMWPKARVVTLNGQAHTANLSAPKMVAKEISNFIHERNR